MINIHIPPSPDIKLPLPIAYKTTRTHDNDLGKPLLPPSTPAYLPHPFTVPLVAGLAEGGRQEGYHLNRLAEAHVIPQYTAFLEDKVFVQEGDTFDLVVAEVL